MLDTYYERELSIDEISSLFKKFKELWGKNDHYWYPLKSIERSDVIAFFYSDFEENVGFEKLREILSNEGDIYEIRESERKGFVIRLSEFDADYDSEEGYWFNSELDWVIYSSHEDSITFAGEKLVTAIKENWKEWSSYKWC